MAEVKIDHISKIYDDNKKSDKRAVNDISFTVHDKEFMVLVGPSGCGKSTLLRMIAGLEEISEGTLSIEGAVINDKSPKERDIAMVFQNYALYPHMTVYDNMAFGLKLKGYKKADIKERVTETARLLEIEEELYRKPKALSGGQRQRVAIGRAIIRRPKVFLFDEPLSNLDAKLRSQMRIELQKLHRELAATIIYVTHDQVEAMTLGTRIAVLNKGKLMQIDSPLHLYNKPENRFVAGFIGSPTMNFIKGSIVKNGETFFVTHVGNCKINLSEKDSSLLDKYFSKPFELGVRPEHIIICEDEEDGKPDCTLTIMAYENMGNEQLVYFTLGEQTLIVRRSPKDTLEYGKEKGIRFDREKLLFMDEASQQVIL